MKSVFFYQTDIGEIGIAESQNAITNIYFNKESIPQSAIIQETKLLEEAAKQLRSYLAGECKKFELPMAPVGTDFLKRVWDELQAIPYGETRSYGEIAKNIGNQRAYRAVGLANNKNPIPIFIPCHRVIGSKGALVGYLGGLEIKENLLKLERLNNC